MIVRESEVRHRADGDGSFAVRPAYDDGAFDDVTGSDDAGLARHEDRGVEQDAAASGVGHRERAGRQVVREQRASTGAVRDIGDAAGTVLAGSGRPRL